MAEETNRARGGWRRLAIFVVAHAVAVGTGSVTLALTGIVVALSGGGPTGAGGARPALSPLAAIGGAPFVIFLGVVAGSVVALPASLVGYPLASRAARRDVRGWRLLALGGVVGLAVGLPLLVATLGAGDPRFLADPLAVVLGAAPTFGPAAFVAGTGYAWAVGRSQRH